MSLMSYRAALPRAKMHPKSLKCWDNTIVKEQCLGLTRFGDDLLSHALRRSTISATALNGRVRDGIGCFAGAVITKPRKT